MSNTITIDNVVTSVAVTTTVGTVPPTVALNFGSLLTLFRNMTAYSGPPSNPAAKDVYLDDGTNTASKTMGFRRYDGSGWEDFGLQTAASTSALGDLSDVTINSVVNG